MAIGGALAHGTAASGTLNSTLAGTIATNAVTTGRVAFLLISGDTFTVSSITDAGGNSWSQVAVHTANSLTSAIWMARITTQLSVGNSYTITFSGNVQDKTATFRSFTTGGELVLAPVGTSSVPQSTTATNGFGSASTSSLVSQARLHLRCLTKAANVTTGLTATGTWTSTGGTRSRNNAAAKINRGEYKLSTSTAETSNPTLANTGNTSSILVAMDEIPDAIGTSTATADAATTAATGTHTAPTHEGTSTATAANATTAGAGAHTAPTFTGTSTVTAAAATTAATGSYSPVTVFTGSSAVVLEGATSVALGSLSAVPVPAEPLPLPGLSRPVLWWPGPPVRYAGVSRKELAFRRRRR